MSAPLPRDLITKIKPLILPYVRDKDEREALFIDTYFMRDPRPMDQISFEGSPDIFVSRCIADLLKKIGCLAEDGEAVTPEHSLSALLQTIRTRCGVEKHAEIDHWLQILNDQCAAPSIEPYKPQPVSVPAQTIDTPTSERTASVFISYSHANEGFASELIAALAEHGHRCWIDTSKIKGGADWQRAICDGINLSYALVVVCTRKALESEYVWDEIQWARTRHKLIIPVLLEDVTDDDRFFGLHRYQGIRFDKLARSQAISALIAALPTPPSGYAPPRALSQREHELAYLDRLRFEDFRLERFDLAEYTALPGEAQTRREVRDSWAVLAMDQEFAVIPQAKHDTDEIASPSEKFTDAVSKITELRRVVVLGEPGAGKTHTLRAIAKPLYTAALTDSTAPIPLLVKLGNWDKPDQPFAEFLRGALGELGTHLDDPFAAKRAILLFDGLNEFPADQRAVKYPQVEKFIEAHPDVMAVVTCREADYPISLHLSKVLIRPLEPLRIRDFARRALRAVESDDSFFWRLIGPETWRFESRFKALFAHNVPNWENVFWGADSLPFGMKWEQEFINTFYYGWERWRALRDNPASILTLARNPYMLRMLLDVYIRFKGELPTNRGQLFDQFVHVLLAREKLAQITAETNVVTLTDEGTALLTGLRQVAFEMQVRRTPNLNKPSVGTSPSQVERVGEMSAGTSLDLAIVREILNERLLYLAVSTSILTTGDEVRFSHQLLQEYFGALYLRERIFTVRLKQPSVDTLSSAQVDRGEPVLLASDIWKPENWWERTNWEEAAILLAGLYSDDCTSVLNWLADANPEVTALCITRSGAYTPDDIKRHLRDAWLLRLTGQYEHNPRARAALGRSLGTFLINEELADNRRGIGLGEHGFPDIVWCGVTDQHEWIYQNELHKSLPSYWIAKYPITYFQFQAFIEADDGWHNQQWWEGLPISIEYNRTFGDQKFKYWNHPRERVSWYDAVAFCRWLTAKYNEHNLVAYSNFQLEGLGNTVTENLVWEIRLPTEKEWERAARGRDGRLYPYGNMYDPTKGNTLETGIGQTSAVGIFLEGRSPVGAFDMSGNVWEWCLTSYSESVTNANSARTPGSDVEKVLRGGSREYDQFNASSVFRLNQNPDFRVSNIGFRVVLSISANAEMGQSSLETKLHATLPMGTPSKYQL